MPLYLTSAISGVLKESYIYAMLIKLGRITTCTVNKGENQLDATNSDILVISYSSTCFGLFYAHHQEVRLCFTACGFCPIVADVMPESAVARCVHYVEGVAWQHPLHSVRKAIFPEVHEIGISLYVEIA